MRIDTLYEFILLATNLNFTDTAKSFFIAQSALSNHISKLERELGAKLFTRDNRSVALTKVGRRFSKTRRRSSQITSVPSITWPCAVRGHRRFCA